MRSPAKQINRHSIVRKLVEAFGVDVNDCDIDGAASDCRQYNRKKGEATT